MATKPVSTYEHEPCIDKCEGCPQQRVAGPGDTHWYTCTVFVSPKAKWRAGNCPMAPRAAKETTKGKAQNPLKASKKKLRGK